MSSFNEIIEFINSNPVCFFATSEDGQPRVRAMLLWFANDSGIYFYTDTQKELYRQLCENPSVEVCFYEKSDALTSTRTVRISGKVEIVDSKELGPVYVEYQKAVPMWFPRLTPWKQD